MCGNKPDVIRFFSSDFKLRSEIEVAREMVRLLRITSQIGLSRFSSTAHVRNFSTLPAPNLCYADPLANKIMSTLLQDQIWKFAE